MSDTQAIKVPFDLQYGTYEDALKQLNVEGQPTEAEFTVNWEMIKIYCSLTEDANLSYWDEAFAKKQWGGIVAPPGLLLTWAMPLQWHPTSKRRHYFCALSLPLPGNTVINVATTTEFSQHLLLGDRITVSDRLIELSPEKSTRLGVGHFLKTKATFKNQKGELIAEQINSLFRFNAHESTQDSARQE